MIQKKENDIYKFSNPSTVYNNAREVLGDEFELRLSPHKNKKYMIRGPFSNNQWIHFGYWGMQDYTKHKNEERRERFRIRNQKWANAEPDTAAFLSYYLLW